MGFYSAFAEYYEAVFPFRDEVFAFLKRHLPAGARRALDAGCGTGHYAGRLAEDGLDVVGVDLDPQMIEVARRRYPAPTFQRLNLTEVGTLPPPFDMIFCIGNVLPHVSPDALVRFLADVYRLLGPGGVWMFQIVNWDFVLERGSYRFPIKRLDVGEAVFHREYRDVSEDRVRFVTRLSDKDRTIFEGDVWLHPLRTDAYEGLHSTCGFTKLGHFADFTEAPYTATETGSVFLFHKP